MAEATYGGRVTDDSDRRVLTASVGRLFCDSAFDAGFQLAPSPAYSAPSEGPLSSHRSHIAMLPASDEPEALGQHANAELSFRVQHARALIDGLVKLTGISNSGSSRDRRDDVLASVTAELLETVSSGSSVGPQEDI